MALDAERARDGFFALVDDAIATLQPGEVLLANGTGETSDFVRLNGGKVRQAGTVEQASIALDLIAGQRHVTALVTISGDRDVDRAHVRWTLDQLRTERTIVPEDPHLLYDETPWTAEGVRTGTLPAPDGVLAAVGDLAARLDLVGLWAAGAVHRGFASSLGHRVWHTATSFHLDFSVYVSGDLAVKNAYAGTQWDDAALAARFRDAEHQLALLKRPGVALPPGRYDAYLEPAAVAEIIRLLGWGGFGCRAHQTKSSPLIRMAADGDGARLDPQVTLREHTAGGVAPPFQQHGFRRPDAVDLVRDGALCDTLVSPRSAREFGIPTNGANADETPESIELGGGTLPRRDALARLGNGVWLGNLHYLNYSDRQHCRTTGMTRFACFRVEHGEIIGPLRPLRFDETLYRLLGPQLVALTAERDLLLAGDTYGGRSTASTHVPGALVSEMTFTL